MMWIWQLIWFLVKGPPKVVEEELEKVPVPVVTLPSNEVATAPVPIVKLTKPTMTNAERVYSVSKSLLGSHLSAENEADGYGKFGCAESVNSVWQKTFNHPLGGGASTAEMLKSLEDTNRFDEISLDDVEAGCVVMCATGTSLKYPYAHGHVAISGRIQFMSNSSETGQWTANYDRKSWEAYFEGYLGFKTRVFKPKG